MSAVAEPVRWGTISLAGIHDRVLPELEGSDAIELVADGAIGELRVVRSWFGFTLGEGENIRARPELDGGALMDVGCYCLSGARLFAGEPETVIGTQVLGPSGVDVRFAATLVF